MNAWLRGWRLYVTYAVVQLAWFAIAQLLVRWSMS